MGGVMDNVVWELQHINQLHTAAGGREALSKVNYYHGCFRQGIRPFNHYMPIFSAAGGHLCQEHFRENLK